MNGRLAQSVSTARQLSACRSTPSSNSSVEVLFIDLWAEGGDHSWGIPYICIQLCIHPSTCPIVWLINFVPEPTLYL